MHAEKALETIRLLADGVDPATGEVFPEDSPFHQPDVIRALHSAAGALQDAARKERKRARKPGNQGKPWTTEAEEMLLREFDEGRSMAELASKFGRSLLAIEVKLHKLGRDPDQIERARPSRRPGPPNEVDDSFVGEVFRHKPKWKA